MEQGGVGWKSVPRRLGAVQQLEELPHQEFWLMRAIMAVWSRGVARLFSQVRVHMRMCEQLFPLSKVSLLTVSLGLKTLRAQS